MQACSYLIDIPLLTWNSVLQHDLLRGASSKDVFDYETSLDSGQVESGAVSEDAFHGIYTRGHHDTGTVDHLDVLVQFHLGREAINED